MPDWFKLNVDVGIFSEISCLGLCFHSLCVHHPSCSHVSSQAIEVPHLPEHWGPLEPPEALKFREVVHQVAVISSRQAKIFKVISKYQTVSHVLVDHNPDPPPHWKRLLLGLCLLGLGESKSPRVSHACSLVSLQQHRFRGNLTSRKSRLQSNSPPLSRHSLSCSPRSTTVPLLTKCLNKQLLNRRKQGFLLM